MINAEGNGVLAALAGECMGEERIATTRWGQGGPATAKHRCRRTRFSSRAPSRANMRCTGSTVTVLRQHNLHRGIGTARSWFYCAARRADKHATSTSHAKTEATCSRFKVRLMAV